jgi:hypothetical protein
MEHVGERKIIGTTKALSIGCCDNADGVCLSSSDTSYKASASLTWNKFDNRSYTASTKLGVSAFKIVSASASFGYTKGSSIGNGKATTKTFSVSSDTVCAKSRSLSKSRTHVVVHSSDVQVYEQPVLLHLETCGGKEVVEAALKYTEFKANWSCKSKGCGNKGTCCPGQGCAVFPCFKCPPAGGCEKGSLWSRSSCKCSKPMLGTDARKCAEKQCVTG